MQAGLDYRLAKNMYLNFDAKWVNIESDLSAGGAYLSMLKINPWLVGVGFGWRF